VHPVHRLDRGTSGALLFARTQEAAAWLGALFDEGLVKKRYLALVRGVAPEEGIVDHPIPRVENGPRVAALTAFRRLTQAPTEPRHVSLVEAFPASGRLHQVRRHLKHVNHPIIGDANYGKGDLNREMAARYGLERLALHAEGIVISAFQGHPEITIHSPLPKDLTDPFDRMGLEWT
jgi:tRNA pseudouridine65 synthase